MYWVKIQIILNILAFSVNVANTEECVSSTQCSDGEICRNEVCEDALYCSGDANPCVAEPGLLCVSDYCQPNPCTSTGQCVHGHVCEHDTPRSCVYPVVYSIENGSECILAFEEPATPGSYAEIQWYKGGRYSLDRLAAIHPAITDNKIQYYNDLCSGNSPCHTSERADLNRDTGELTINSSQLSDEDVYYYKFFNYDGTPDTGIRYEYKLNIFVVPDLTIQGIPENYVEVGTSLTLTCTADRIKPEPLGMYWKFNGINVTGFITTKEEDRDGVFTYRSYFVFTVAKDDANKPITCVVVPVHSDPVTMETTVNPGYAPTGKPVIQVSTVGQYKGEKVTLTCDDPEAAGNPACNTYDWIKPGGNSSTFKENLPNTQVYTFIMDELHAGNYTCQCSNVFGESEVSDVVEILYLGEKDDVGLIVGSVVGGLVLVTLVIVAVIICRKYKINFNINVDLNFKSRKDGEKNTPSKNTVDSNGYENPVASQSRARSTVNEYDEINEGAMVRTRQEGYVNVTMTTYEDLL